MEEIRQNWERFRFLELDTPESELWEKVERYTGMPRAPRPFSGQYVLVGHTPVPAEEAFPVGDALLLWATWFERANRRVRSTHFGPRSQHRVSTVFLGIDHGFDRFNDPAHTPILFETMIFGGPLDGWQDRYATWEEAVAGHQEAVRLARATLPHGGAPRARERRRRR